MDTLTTEARDTLAATPTRELLAKAYSLTHRIDRAATEAGVAQARRMRDLITDEVVRRTGAQS